MARNQYWFWTLTLLIGCSGSSPQPPSLFADEIPREWLARVSTVDSAPLTAWWVLSTSDCMSCESFEYVLRRLHYAYPERIKVRVVHIENAKHGNIVLGRFLARERLDVPVISVNRREHLRSSAGEWPVPVLIIARNDTVVWYQASDGTSPLSSIPATVDSLILVTARDAAPVDQPPSSRENAR